MHISYQYATELVSHIFMKALIMKKFILLCYLMVVLHRLHGLSLGS